MKDNVIRMAVCPRCGKTYYERPALSRADNETLICPDCGTREALESIGVDTREQEKILAIIRRSSERTMKEERMSGKTVREWMCVEEIRAMNLMTGSGYIHLERADFPEILQGASVTGHLEFRGSEHKIDGEDYLDREVTSWEVKDGILSGIV